MVIELGEVVLHVVGLRKIYEGNVVAVDGVSFSIERPSFIAILGPNGAGKTTLLNMLAGVLPPTSGTITIMGMDLWREGAKVKRLIGFVPQEMGIWNELTVYENLMFSATLHDVSLFEARRRARELMKLMGLEEHRKKLASKLSGGLRRRLAIAMALIHDPKILILDEPTTGLDPGIRLELLRMLRRFVSEGRLVIMSTHISEDAERCDEVMIMHRGKILAFNKPDNLKEKVMGLVTVIDLHIYEDIDRAMNILRDRWVVSKTENKLSIMVRSFEKELPQIMELLTSRGIDVAEVRVRKPTLSDVFIKLTGYSLES